MKSPLFYSVRMHSERDQQHHSGAEHLCCVDEVSQCAQQLVERALMHSRGCAESIHLTVEQVLSSAVKTVPALPVKTCNTSSVEQARHRAAALLQQVGVAPRVVALALQRLAEGANGQGGSMRGAMLVDARTGERLEPDPFRGVRVSRMDLARDCRSAFESSMKQRGLDHPAVRDALILASKALSSPAIIAEVCWSDDPDYTTGYVATDEAYWRLPRLKHGGDRRGGRALFVDTHDLNLVELIDYLQQTPVLVHWEHTDHGTT